MSHKKKLMVITLATFAIGAVALVIAGPFLLQSAWSNLQNDSEVDSLVRVVSLIELHRLRNGQYPATLDELEYLGQWDGISVSGMDYAPAPDHSAYFLQPRSTRARTVATMPEEFWRGTGYRAELSSLPRPPPSQPKNIFRRADEGPPAF